MAAITTDSLFTVRSLTSDGELVAETEPMDEGAAMATFDDMLEGSEAGIFVQLIAEDGSIATEEIAK